MRGGCGTPMSFVHVSKYHSNGCDVMFRLNHIFLQLGKPAAAQIIGRKKAKEKSTKASFNARKKAKIAIEKLEQVT